MAEKRERRLKVEWDRIVHPGCDALALERLTQLVPVRAAHHEQMPHGLGAFRDWGKLDDAVEARPVAVGVPSAQRVPFVEAAKLHPQHRRLERVEALVPAEHDVLVLLALPE